VHAYADDPPVLSWAEGNVQVLSDGNTFVGFGSEPYIAEFGPSGSQLFSVHFSRPLQVYRAYRYVWWGHPTWPPSVAAGTTPHGTWVWASWNGSTQVASWQVLAGASPTSLSPIGKFPKVSFETQMWFGSTQAWFAVQALDQTGNVIATSQPTAR
jgi:hypothetical protein